MTQYILHEGAFRLPADLEEAPASEESRERLYPRVIGLARRILRLQGITLTMDGVDNLPLSGGALLAINHTGYYDFIFAGAPAWFRGRRLVRFMAKKEVFDAPGAGTLMRWMKHVPVDRFAGAQSIIEAKKHLQSGSLVGIFPEATISRSFELKEFKTGAARIAQEAGVPLIPVTIWGSQRVWTKGGKANLGWVGLPVWVTVGEPVNTEGTPAEVTARLKAEMQDLLVKTREKYAAEYGPFGDGLEWMPAEMGGTAPALSEANRMDDIDRNAKALKRQRRAAREAAKSAKKADKKLAKKARKQLDRLAKFTRKSK